MGSIFPLLFVLLASMSAAEDCKVKTKEVVLSVYGSGYVKSERYTLLKASVSGRVEKIYVDTGDVVKRGQLLLVINSGGLEDKIRAVDSRIALLKSKLMEESDFMRQLRGELKIAEENLSKAREKYLRRKRLFEKGVIPRETMEEAQRLYRLAKEQRQIVLSKIRSVREELKAELKALIEEKKAMAKELEKYRLRSPIDGVILKRFVGVGDYVNHIARDNLLLSLGSRGKKVILQVEEEFAPLIKSGQKVYLSLDAFGDRVFQGKVHKIDIESDPVKRLVNLEVSVELPPSLPVNSVAEGNIVVSRLKTTVVPLRAVKDGFAVFQIKGDIRKVKVNRVFENYAEVLGVPPGTPCLIKN